MSRPAPRRSTTSPPSSASTAGTALRALDARRVAAADARAGLGRPRHDRHLADTDEMAIDTIARRAAPRLERDRRRAPHRVTTSRSRAYARPRRMRRRGARLVGAHLGRRARLLAELDPTPRVAVGHRDARDVVRQRPADGDVGARPRRPRRARRCAARHRPARARGLARDRARSPTRTRSPGANRRRRAAGRAHAAVGRDVDVRSRRRSRPASRVRRGEYCRVFVQRLRAADAVDLRAVGDAAVAALTVARGVPLIGPA